MQLSLDRGKGLVLSSAIAVLGAASPAHAVNCADLPNPVYGYGGSASKTFLAKLGQVTAGLAAPNQLTIVFQAPGACLGIYALLADTKITGTASYWDTSGTEKTCDLPAAGQVIDFANMTNSAALCTQAPNPLPATIADVEGPINTVNLIANVGSSQSSISEEAAYFVFGFGNAGQAAPWTVESDIIIRDANSGVQQLLGAAINVPADKFKYGVNGANQSGVISKVAAGGVQSAIGIVSGEAADAARASVKTLAYQRKGQSCGYFPDSTSSAWDKQNVRDGHYWMWAPQHFFAKQSGGVVTSVAAKTLIDLVSGATTASGFDLIKIESQASTIPKCAMKVQRVGDLGALSKYTPAQACGCYYESFTPGGTQCAACSATSPCASGSTCNFGYCEKSP